MAVSKYRNTLLKKLLAVGDDPNISNGDIRTVTALLDGDARPDNPRDSSGRTAL